MKRLILGIILIAGITTIAGAQTKTKIETKKDGKEEVKIKGDQKADGPAAAAEAKTVQLRLNLHVTSSQYKQLYDVNLLIEQKLAALENVTDDKANALLEIDEYRKNQYKQILSEEQYRQWSRENK